MTANVIVDHMHVNHTYRLSSFWQSAILHLLNVTNNYIVAMYLYGLTQFSLLHTDDLNRDLYVI